MDRAAVEQVRSFNRVVAQRVGALHDRYLARDRPLGASRLLWEIGDGGVDVRHLRDVLDLDSGYLSRLLRSLEDEGLVVVEPRPDDARIRTVRLTPAGTAEWHLLDRRSDELAATMVAPLNGDQQERLLRAMHDVESLLTAAMVTVDTVDPTHRHAEHCLRAYFADLDARFPLGFDLDGALPVDLDSLRPPAGAFLVATLRGRPVGCAALKHGGAEPPEVKRMWVDPSARGLGLGRRLLGEVEAQARARGNRSIRLDTNATLTEAIALYRSSGYREVPAYNDEPNADRWFEKAL
jgi:DNA-binding MarR family transcriptional regulator/N-acetylglutamate synthase-like GNAT family acetyltransferase